jgi:hypothetical protein
MDAAQYLQDLAIDLARSALVERDLVALVFEANGRDVDVRTKRNAHATSYPLLSDLLSGIGANCVKGGITVSQLRRIVFAERQVTVEFAGKEGGVQTRVYVIEGVIGAAKPSAASGAALQG